MENLRSIGVFVRAVELRSFAATAVVLGLTPSAVSKSIASLEASLKVRLLLRSSRGVMLTDEGERFYARCRSIVLDLERAEREVSQGRTVARGRLRVALHVTPGRFRILPELPRFMEDHPDVQLEVMLLPGARNLKAEGIDVGVFIGDPPASDLVARRVADHQFAICASERYLERHGSPRRPDDLSRHNCIEYLQPDGKSPEWTFQKDGDVQTIPVRGNLKVNDGQAMVDMAGAGIGIARVMQMTAEAMIATGAVIPLLTDWKVEAPPIHVLYAPGTTQSARVRAFVDFITDVFRDMPTTRSPTRRWPMRRG
jgi:LysR family transcriptional regulator, regulator for bpeEF and oprC